MKFKPTQLSEIAAHLGAEIEGEGAQQIRRMAAFDEAGPGDLTFAANSRVAGRLAGVRASAVIVGRGLKAAGATEAGMATPALLRVEDPYLAFARALRLLTDLERPAAGVRPGAHVAPSARLGEGVAVMAGGYVGEQAVLGARSVVYPGAVLMERVRAGADCLFYPGVVVREDCRLGDRVTLHANATVGSDGFGFAKDGATHVKIPQIGDVVIGDDVEVGACTCIDRAALGSTVIGSGTKIDNLVMVAHGCQIGENTLIIAQSGIAGGAVIEEGATLGARAGVLGHLTVGAGSVLLSRTHLTKSIPPGSTVSGNPARPHKEDLKQSALLARMEKLLARVTALEKEVAELKGEK